jgi:beta-phosphoglucomutase
MTRRARASARDRSATMTTIRAIVLDFNGTLAQDDHLISRLCVDAFATVGAPLEVEEYYRELAALPDRDVFTMALKRAGLPFDVSRRDQLVSARVDGYLAAVREQPPIDAHAIAFVRAAARRVPLAIASGACRREIESVLIAAGLFDQFAVVVPIDDVRNGKPDPESFERALAGLNAGVAPGRPIEPAEVVAVEDATGGAQAARAAGMHVAAIRGAAYDESSGLAELVIERLDPSALELMLEIGEGSG